MAADAAIHIDGTANACRSVYRRMHERGAGSIVTIGSELGLMGDPEAAHYAAAKGAIHAFTKSLAMEAVTHGIRVNCVAPGPADTPLLKQDMRSPEYVNTLVLQRIVQARGGRGHGGVPDAGAPQLRGRRAVSERRGGGLRCATRGSRAGSRW